MAFITNVIGVITNLSALVKISIKLTALLPPENKLKKLPTKPKIAEPSS